MSSAATGRGSCWQQRLLCWSIFLLLIPCLTQVHPCYRGPHRGPALPGDLPAAPGTAESWGQPVSPLQGGRGCCAWALPLISLTAVSDTQDLPVWAVRSLPGPRVLLFLLLVTGHPTGGRRKSLKSRNLWDQIFAFNVLQHLLDTEGSCGLNSHLLFLTACGYDT